MLVISISHHFIYSTKQRYENVHIIRYVQISASQPERPHKAIKNLSKIIRKILDEDKTNIQKNVYTDAFFELKPSQSSQVKSIFSNYGG